MCRSCGRRHNSVVADTSPSGPQHDGSLDSISSTGYIAHGWRSGVSSGDGCGVGVPGSSGNSGGRSSGLTMKEYDQHLSRLNKENFALKLRVYFLEEKQGQAGHAAPQLYKANIELKVENESLKRQVFDKQQLLSQASAALNQLDEEYKEQISDLLRRHEDAVANLQGTVRELQQSVEQYLSRCRELEASLRCQPASGPTTLSQLCDLAFSTTDPAAVPAASNGGGGGTGENSGATTDVGWTGPLSSAAPWGGNSPTAALWGFDGPAAPNLGSAGAASASAEEAAELQRKMSTDSQGSTGSCPAADAASASVTATNPVNINTTNVTNNNINNTLPNTSNNLQQMQCQQQPPHAGASHQHFHHYQQQQPESNSCSTGGGVAQSSSTCAGATAAPFSLPATLEGPQQHQAGPGKVNQVAAAAVAAEPAVLSGASVQGSTSAVCLAAEKTRVHQLEEEVTELEHRMWQLEEQLGHKDQLTAALREDLDNLRKELQEKESEVLEREEKVESLSQELETRHRQLQCKDDTINTLHTDLNRVEPEISVKVQEIVERDRIIEEKIEQIEQQNKILVEIQITLDEKQKQIAELEASLDAARQRVTQLERDYDKSCQAINGFIGDVSQRDKEIANLKKDAKKRERKIKDLVAELKETLDMLGKAKWEAETAGGCGQDTVKEMVEEENERLWAEMEQKKTQVQSLKGELSEAAADIKRLSEELSECLGALQRRDEAEQQQRTELEALRAQTENREALAKQQDLEMEGLKEELSGLHSELNDKRQELKTLRESVSVSASSTCDCVKSADKDGHQQNVEQLLRELSVCKADRVREVELLRGQLELKNSDILHLQSQLIGEAMHAGSEAMAAAVAAAATPDSRRATSHVAPADSTAVQIARYEPMQVSITAKLLGSSYPAAIVAGSHEEKCKEFDKNLPLNALTLSSSSDEPGRADNKEDHLNSRGVNSEVSAIGKFQKQIENLRNELRDTKSSIYNQKAELGNRSYQEIVRKYRSECNSLRKNLKESNHACDLLRSRLEELAEFLEQIIYMDEQGLIDLSKLSGFNKASLHKSLNDSRALSQTLSQSILTGMDTLMEESFCSQQEGDMEMLGGLQSLLPNDSLYCNGTVDLLQTTGGGNKTCVSSVLCESWLPDNSEVTMNETGGRLLANNLYAEIDLKAKKLDDILVQVALLSADLCRRESERDQADLVASLKKRLAEKEEELITLQKSHQSVDIVCVTSPQQQPEYETSHMLEVACQTLLAMAPRQSVVSYLSSSSDTQSIPSLDPLIEEALASFNDSEPCVKNLETILVDAIERQVIGENPTEHPEHNTNTVKFPASLPGRCVVSADDATDPAAPAKPQLAAGCVSACEVPATPHHIPASPSESEAWSEPDRNVSLARIGLETCTLAASLDRSLSRSRQTRASAALSSESDTEECQVMDDDNVTSLPSAGNANAGLLVAGGIKAMPKRKSDASEVRRLAAKLRTMEHLNETLKAELNIYQSLSYQLSPTTDQQQSDQKSSIISGSKSASSYMSGPVNQLGVTDPYSTSSSATLTTSGLSATTTSRVACPSLPLTTPASSLSSATTKKPRRLPMTVDGSEGLALAAPLLQEIRSLRSKLEESISNNDQLRDQLEAAVLSCSRASAADDQQPSHLTHLTAALLNAQETLQLTREKLSFAQRCEQVQADRCAAAERRTDEEAKLCLELRAQLRDAHTQAAAATAHIEVAQMKWMKQLEEMKESTVVVELKLREQVDELSDSKQAQEGKFRVEVEELKAKYNAMEEKLKEARRDHEASEASLQARLSEVTRAYEESESRMSEQHAAISEVYASLHAAPQWPHLSHLHSVLQASETQVLRVTRDRLVLLGEKSKLQAQLMSVQAQTSLLQDSLCDDNENQHEQTMPGLHQQLAKVQVAVKRMQDQCSRLQAANRVLSKEKEHLEEKLAGYKAVEKLVNKSDITLESVSNTATPHESSRVSSVALQQLQRQHALLQDDYTHLQRLYTLLQEDEQHACQKLQATSISLQRAQLNIEALSKQYQDKVQQLQREWQSKMAGAEQQVKETQARCQETVKAMEEKVSEVHGITQKKVDAMTADTDAQVKQLQAHVKQLQKQTQVLRGQLDGEKKVCVSLRAELQEATTVLKQRTAAITSSGAAWSGDDKNFLHHPCPTATASPHKSTGRALSIKCTPPVPVKSCEARLSTGTSPLNSISQSCGGRNTRHASHSVKSQVKSPGRQYLASEQSAFTYATEDELEHDLSESVDGMRRGCDSPDLGLGSSDNGHMSSLERVMLSTRGKSGTQHSSSRKASQRLGPLPYQHQQHIAVVISERSSLPASPEAAGPSVSVDQLCSVPSHASLSQSNTLLRTEVQRLQQEACSSTARLAEIQRQLTAANDRKQTVERAICRQLTKTHQVLQKAKGNLLQQRDGKEGAGGGDRHSSLV